MSLDLQPILHGFAYAEGELSARRVVGDDGLDKIQIRIHCGLIQFEADGHPAGVRPFDHESLLAYHTSRLEGVRALAGSDAGFSLTTTDCEALREEAILYYARYVACQALHDYARAQRDCERNLELLDLCRDYAEEASDRGVLESYRPYLVLMVARARAGQLLEAGELLHAIESLTEATREARGLVDEQAPGETGPPGLPDSLAGLFDGLRVPPPDSGPLAALLDLHRELEDAVRREDYRRAAALRDQILRFHEAEDGGAVG